MNTDTIIAALAIIAAAAVILISKPRGISGYTDGNAVAKMLAATHVPWALVSAAIVAALTWALAR